MIYEEIAAFEKYMEACRTHLEKSSHSKTLVYPLVRLLVIDACAAYEKTMRGAVYKMAERSCRPEFGRYVKKSFEMLYRSPGTSRTLLKTLSCMYEDEFENSVSKEKQDAYKKLILTRNEVAHGGRTDIGMGEVIRMHQHARVVPIAFAAILESRVRGLHT